MATTNETPHCDRCGIRCVTGHQIRYYGEPDPETGYRDEEVLCNDCADAAEPHERSCDCPACSEDRMYEAADAAYDLSRED